VQKGDLPNEKHFAIYEDPFAKPSYLFALVVGKFACLKDNFKTGSGKNVSLNIYASEKNIDKCNFAMQVLKLAMAWDEKVFGLEYDLDIFNIVGIDDFNAGAMENKSLNIYNASRALLVDSKISCDDDFDFILQVVSHEYFHNYSGNRVTCRNWFELSLKEGFTNFRDHEFYYDTLKTPVARINKVQDYKDKVYPEELCIGAHPVLPKSYINANNLYSSTIYDKGCELINLLKTWLGKEKFCAGCKHYFEKFDGQAVTINDFLDAIEEKAQVDISQFRLWYHQAGIPSVNVQETYDDAQKKYSLTLTQSQNPTPDMQIKEPLLIPLDMALIVDGQDIKNEKIILKERTQTFVFDNVGKMPLLSINRGYNAPILIKQNLPPQKYLQVWREDSDAYNRYQAGQNYMEHAIEKILKGENINFLNYLSSWGRILEENIDKAFKAYLIALPNVNNFVQLHELVDMQKLVTSYAEMAKVTASNYEQKILQMYETHKTGDDAFTPSEVGRRQLVSELLYYINAQNHEDIILKHYYNATSMTDKINALNLIKNFESDEFFKAFEHFENEYKDEDIAMNYWLALQVSSNRGDTLERLRNIVAKGINFDFKRPNKTNILMRNFAGHRNMCKKDFSLNFHSLAGYETLAQIILQVDKYNNSSAADGAQAFYLVDKLDKTSAKHITQVVEGMLQEKVSDALYENLSKVLKGQN
jgi:aminopeptidase N